MPVSSETFTKGPDLFRHPCLMGWRAWPRSTARAYIAAAGSGIGSRNGSIRRSAGFRISSVSAAAAFLTLIQGVACWLCRRALRFDRVKLPLLGAKRSFRMGVAGWRFAHVKRNLSGRAAIVAVLEDWQVICSAVVAAGSMIMLGFMLYRDWPQ